MMVQWVTRDRGSPGVRWGRRPGRYTASAPGDSATYALADMCGPPANASGWAEPGWLHGAVMAGLQPGQRYYYRYGDLSADDEGAWSGEETFVAPPAPGSGATVTLLAVADLGQAEVDGSMEASEMVPSLATAARLAAEVDAGAQLLVHNGDISCELPLATPPPCPARTPLPQLTLLCTLRTLLLCAALPSCWARFSGHLPAGRHERGCAARLPPAFRCRCARFRQSVGRVLRSAGSHRQACAVYGGCLCGWVGGGWGALPDASSCSCCVCCGGRAGGAGCRR